MTVWPSVQRTGFEFFDGGLVESSAPRRNPADTGPPSKNLIGRTKMTDEQKLALAKMLNLLMALAVNSDFSSQSHRDIWDAAEAFGISKLDLLKATS